MEHLDDFFSDTFTLSPDKIHNRPCLTLVLQKSVTKVEKTLSIYWRTQLHHLKPPAKPPLFSIVRPHLLSPSSVTHTDTLYHRPLVTKDKVALSKP